METTGVINAGTACSRVLQQSTEATPSRPWRLSPTQATSLQRSPLSSNCSSDALSDRQVQSLAAVCTHDVAGGNSALRNAWNAIVEGHDLAAHMDTLREHYGSIKPLIPYLQKTVSAHPDVVHTENEWNQLIRHHPDLFKMVPEHFLTDDFYLHWCCLRETFELLPATMAEDRKRSLCAQACLQRPAMLKVLPCQYMSAQICTEACDQLPWMLEFVPDEYRSTSLCFSVCSADPRQFAVLRGEQKTAYTAQLACRHDGDMLKYVDPLKRTAELCLAACQSNGLALQYVPEHCLNEHPELYSIACHNEGLALQYVPEDYLHEHPELCFIACDKNGLALQYVPERCIKDHPKLYSIACQNDGLALQYVPPAERSVGLCQMAVSDNGNALQYVPGEHCTPELCTSAFNATYGGRTEEVLSLIPVDWRTQEMYDTVPRCGPGARQPIPDHINRTLIDRRSLLGPGSKALNDIPVQHRTPEICQKAFSHPGASQNIEAVPEHNLRMEFFIAAIDDDRWDPELHRLAQTHLPDSQYHCFLAIAVSRHAAMQLQVLTCPVLTAALRAELIHFMETGQTRFLHAYRPDSRDLYSTESPLLWESRNTSATTLLTTCYSNPNYEPPYLAEGDSLERYIEAELELFGGCKRLRPDQQPRLYQQGELTGGRTLQIEEGDTVLCYKFQREEEALETLVREGLVHSYREAYPDSRMGQMASELPYDPFFFELDEENWPDDINEWPDPPRIYRRADRSCYINVYRYRVATSYHHYAHQQDSDSADPWEKPETGIVNACHDMGLMAGMGLPLTSMLPAFHDTKANREWLALHSLLGNSPFGGLPGILGAWNSVATEYPDISHGGIRDIGDYEPYDAIESVLNHQDLYKYVQPGTVGQKLAFANIICENLLAAILVRCRLRQQRPDYHMDNPKAVHETMLFIEKACWQFVVGMEGQPGSPELLPRWMRLSDDHYRHWLERTACEVLYWTAAQPDYQSPDTPAFSATDSPWDHRHCYALDLSQTGRLCTTLYPDQPKAAARPYRTAFFNRDKHLNLGAIHTFFPLISLLKGLTTLAAGLVSEQPRAQQQGEQLVEI